MGGFVQRSCRDVRRVDHDLDFGKVTDLRELQYRVEHGPRNSLTSQLGDDAKEGDFQTAFDRVLPQKQDAGVLISGLPEQTESGRALLALLEGGECLTWRSQGLQSETVSTLLMRRDEGLQEAIADAGLIGDGIPVVGISRFSWFPSIERVFQDEDVGDRDDRGVGGGDSQPK